MLMPARVEAMFNEEQTRSVVASASGTELMSLRSVAPIPFWMRAEKPPMKSMPKVSAARSMAWAMGERSSSLQPAAIWATGVTETRLFAMGMPYSSCRSFAVWTRFSAVVVILS